MKLNEEKLTDEALKQYLFDNLAEETKLLSSKQLATTFNSVSVDEIIRIIQNQERMYFLTKEEKELIIEALKHFKTISEKEINSRLKENKTLYDEDLDYSTGELTAKTCKIEQLLDKLGE